MRNVVNLFIVIFITGFYTSTDSMESPSVQQHFDDNNLTYSVNLMWINQSLSQDQKYLCADQTDEGFKMKCLDPIMEWIKKSDEHTPIYFWYDSKHTNENALNNTRVSILKEMTDLKKPHGIIKFQDVRDIEVVRNNEEAFSDKLLVYFRSDLLRVVVGDELSREKRTRYIVYSDLNIPPLSKEELFYEEKGKSDKETLKNLEEYGLVLAKNATWDDSGKNYENAFFILDTQNDDMIRAIRVALIDINIDRARYVFEHGYSTHADDRHIWSSDGLSKDRPKVKEEILKFDNIKDPIVRIAERDKFIRNSGIRISKILCESQFPQIIWMTYPNVFKLYLFYKMRGDIDDPQLKDKHKVYEIDGRFFGLKKWKIGQYVFPIIEEVQIDPNDSSIYIDTANKRKQQYHTSLNLFDVLSPNLKYPFSSWIEQNFISDSGDTIKKTEVHTGFHPSSIPTKDVEKPRSSFYGTTNKGSC